MQYNSTRNHKQTASPAEAVLRGIAPDGGLYLCDPATLPLDPAGMLQKDFAGMAEAVLVRLLPDYTPEMLRPMIAAAYGKFDTADITPLVMVGDYHVLELFHGPTCAFKDVALSLLPYLITGAKQLLNDKAKTVILTATSGDTGKAALEGFCDVTSTSIVVFYPKDGVSKIQERQMVTQRGKNVSVAAVHGNFDDAQTGVKHIFAEVKPTEKAELSSANSINIGRLAPQIIYYWYAWAALCRAGKINPTEPVNFSVPTGNFGDILAGYFAKCMGLPVGKLLCASNANNVLTEFLTTGRYDRRRPFYKTSSPSMDILVSSNLERLLYLASGGDAKMVAEKMQELDGQGWYQIGDTLLKKIQKVFLCGCCDDTMTSETIKTVWERDKYLLDPHTAVAWAVAKQYRAELDGQTVVLSTASPYKFAPAVLAALGQKVPDDAFAAMAELQTLTGVPVPTPLAELETLPVLHHDCIEVSEMADYVRRKMEG